MEEEEEKEAEQETHKERKTRFLHFSPWNNTAGPQCRTSTVWTLKILHPVLNYLQHLHAIYQPIWASDLLLCSVLWDLRKTGRREGHIRTSLTLASSLPKILE